jgi:hypothetical protein
VAKEEEMKSWLGGAEKKSSDWIATLGRKDRVKNAGETPALRKARVGGSR